MIKHYILSLSYARLRFDDVTFLDNEMKARLKIRIEIVEIGR